MTRVRGTYVLAKARDLAAGLLRAPSYGGAGFSNSAALTEYEASFLTARSMLVVTKKIRRIAVNWEQTKGKWNQTKGAVKKQWGKLTDDDLTVIAGQRDQLVGKIQERYGIAKEEAD